MPRGKLPYPAEYRARMVDLVRAGRAPEELAKEFEPSAESIRNWVKQADQDEGRRQDGLTTDEKEELRRLPIYQRPGGHYLLSCDDVRQFVQRVSTTTLQ